MSAWDIIDEVIGRFEWIGEAWSTLTTARKGTVRGWYARADKWKGESAPGPTGAEINAHLKRYGVHSVMAGNFDSRRLSYKYRKSQIRWHDWLVREVSDPDSPTGTRIELRTPKSSWTDGRRRLRRRRR
jgi:hypothetical protein